jgi:protein required for attachment to host cells
MKSNAIWKNLDLLNVKTRWYLLASRKEAGIYRGNGKKMQQVTHFSCPEGRMHQRDLTASAGSQLGDEAGSRAYSLDRRNHRRDEIAKKFALRIGEFLKNSHLEGRYRDLVVFAEPHFLGILRNNFPATVVKTISREIGREYNQDSESEVRKNVLRTLGSAA